MARWYTVAPLHNLYLGRDVRFAFADDLVLTNLPSWVKTDRLVNDLSPQDCSVIAETSHCFSVEYEAQAFGSPDPEWKGDEPRSIQGSKQDLVVLANLALWLSRPSPACFVFAIHGPKLGESAMAQSINQPSPLLCHPSDLETRLSTEDVELARDLHSSLVQLPQDHSVWTATRSTWAALQMNIRQIRYLLFWVALEALYGPEDARETTFRLAQRMALFLAETPSEARKLFVAAKRCYGFRSKVAHGRWKQSPKVKVDSQMAETETLVRRSMVRILGNSELTAKFRGKERESYLDDLVFSNRN